MGVREILLLVGFSVSGVAFMVVGLFWLTGLVLVYEGKISNVTCALTVSGFITCGIGALWVYLGMRFFG